MHPDFNVHTYGALGDGAAKDTAALQAAIDACNAAGGGRVLVPAGVYVTGTLWLKSRVELYLSAGATLLGSPDRSDYNADDAFPGNEPFYTEHVSGAHLLIAWQQEDITLGGPGKIDGNSAAFLAPLPDTHRATYRAKTGNFPFTGWRPGQMVFFIQCRRCNVRDISLVNAPYWTLFLYGCEEMAIRGVRIQNPPATPNGDGIDIDCCRNVTVSDCQIASGDDSITLRANGEGRLPNTPNVCENIAVANCILSSPCNAVRVGVGSGTIRNCTFSNLLIPEARTGISIVSAYRPNIAKGVRISGVDFNGVRMDVAIPMSISVGSQNAREPRITDIGFSNFRITASAAAQWVGSPASRIARVSMHDVQFTLRGGTENPEFRSALPESIHHFGFPGVDGKPALPCALFGRHLEAVSFSDITLCWDAISIVWLYGFLLEASEEVLFERITARPPHPRQGAAIACRACSEVEARDCRETLAGGRRVEIVELESPAPDTHPPKPATSPAPERACSTFREKSASVV